MPSQLGLDRLDVIQKTNQFSLATHQIPFQSFEEELALE